MSFPALSPSGECFDVDVTKLHLNWVITHLKGFDSAKKRHTFIHIYTHIHTCKCIIHNGIHVFIQACKDTYISRFGVSKISEILNNITAL